MSDFLCHDLKTPRADAGQRLPMSFRAVPVMFYLALVATAYFATSSYMTIRRAEAQRQAAEEAKIESEAEKQRHEDAKLMVDIERAKAESLAKWIEGTRMMQPICVAAARAMRQEVRFAELRLERNSALPAQIDVTMRLVGPDADAGDISSIENAFTEVNYRPFSPQQARSKDVIDYKSTLVFAKDLTE
jgi:hypothetical protein